MGSASPFGNCYYGHWSTDGPGNGRLLKENPKTLEWLNDLALGIYSAG